MTFRIIRDAEGKHWVGSILFRPTNMQYYRKKVLTQAVQMEEPFSVETLEGTMEGKAGDWLMIGVKGEMYPCDANIFDATYDKVVDGAGPSHD